MCISPHTVRHKRLLVMYGVARWLVSMSIWAADRNVRGLSWTRGCGRHTGRHQTDACKLTITGAAGVIKQKKREW